MSKLSTPSVCLVTTPSVCLVTIAPMGWVGVAAALAKEFDGARVLMFLLCDRRDENTRLKAIDEGFLSVNG